MNDQLTRSLPEAPDDIAPDGMEVRLLLTGEGGGMAHFRLAPPKTGHAVVHRTVEEIWYFLEGEGQMWRQGVNDEAPVVVGPGVCVRIPVHTIFQLRATGDTPLSAVAVTMPPWPGKSEAIVITQCWEPSLE